MFESAPREPPILFFFFHLSLLDGGQSLHNTVVVLSYIDMNQPWIYRFTCILHPDPPSHLPLYPIPLGLPSAPGPSTCLMHPTWAGDLFHILRKYVCKTGRKAISFFLYTKARYILKARWRLSSQKFLLIGKKC